jgi:hypothetical protein
MKQPRCPQFWATFAVRGTTGTYEVYCDGHGSWHCTCRAWIFGGRSGCKHTERVQRHGCFGTGPNDLRAVGVEIVGENPTRVTAPTNARCACGEPMLAPLIRTHDDAGHQVVQVTFGGQAFYTYASSRELVIGQTVTVGGNPGTVVGLGSDYTGPLKVVA